MDSPVVETLVDRLRSVSSGWVATSTGFAAQHPEMPLPADYLSVLEAIGPGEGFVGERFLRLYPLDTFFNRVFQEVRTKSET